MVIILSNNIILVLQFLEEFLYSSAYTELSNLRDTVGIYGHTTVAYIV